MSFNKKKEKNVYPVKKDKDIYNLDIK